MPYLYATAGDIQAKPTRVSGGFDFLVITGQTIVGPSDYILRLVFIFITGKTIVWPSDYILCLVFYYHRPDGSRAEWLCFTLGFIFIFIQEPFEVFS